MWTKDGKKYLEPKEGLRIYAAAAALTPSLNQKGLARKVAPDKTDPARHLRCVLKGNTKQAFNFPLTDIYAERIAAALGCGLDRLWRVIAGSDELVASQFSSFTIVRPTTISPEWKADNFYNGNRPTWDDLEADFDIPRHVYTKEHGIKSCLNGMLSRVSGLQAVAIIGAGGTGKTTLLRRAAYDAARTGCLVLFLNPEWTIGTEGLVSQLRRACASSTLPVVVVIDDISNDLFVGSTLSRVINELENERVILLFAEHPDRWHGVLKRLPMLVRDANCWIHPVHQLFDQECEQLVDRILAFEADGTLSQVFCDLPRDGRLALCHELAERHLVVAMLQMRHGLKFENIIENEYTRIPLAVGKEAYGLVCYFETLRLFLPTHLLLRVLNIVNSTATEEFFECTDGLFNEENDSLMSRNRLIARTVAKRALARPEAKKAALVSVFAEIDTDDEAEMRLFLRAFTGESVHRRFVSDLAREPHLVADLYDDILERLNDRSGSVRKFILSSHGLADRVLQNPDSARLHFQRALEVDETYEFAFRQLAWLELGLGHWDIAATHIQKAAALEPHNFRAVYDAARILTLNTVRWFSFAHAYWLRAIELDPLNSEVKKELETYQDCAIQLGHVKNLKDDDLIPEFVWNTLRPGMLFDKMRYGPDDRRVVKGVRKSLKLMQQDTSGSVTELSERVAGVDIDNDKVMRALYLANVARLEFVSWRQQDSALEATDLAKLFEDGIHINPDDPFAHCWFGTFLKEAQADFVGAQREYLLAIELGKRGSDRLLQDHPLFLNNLALLIIDEVQLRRRKPEELKQAKQLLEKAAARVPETKPDFYWPEHNLDWCKALMEQYGVA